jgi:hypothetical protein
MTHKFAIAGHEGYLTIGLFEDGAPGEIFIKMSKEGSTLSGLIQGFCRAFSLAMQYGLTVEDAVDRFRGMRFDPMGSTNNPDIPEVSSILDYVARYLELYQTCCNEHHDKAPAMMIRKERAMMGVQEQAGDHDEPGGTLRFDRAVG